MADDTFDEPLPMEYFGSRPYDYEEIWKPRPTRRLFAGYSPSMLQEMNHTFANNWDCGICSETAEDPCVTRCGHLFCQKDLLQWFETDPNCPRCKMPCSPSIDAMPVFARDWTPPFILPPTSLSPTHRSSTPSGQSSSLSSRQSPVDYITYEKLSGSPTPTQLLESHAPSLFLDPSRSPSSVNVKGPKSLKKSPSTVSLSPVFNDSPHTTPLAVSEIVAHYGGSTLRIIGLLILLFALLR